MTLQILERNGKYIVFTYKLNNVEICFCVDDIFDALQQLEGCIVCTACQRTSNMHLKANILSNIFNIDFLHDEYHQENKVVTVSGTSGRMSECDKYLIGGMTFDISEECFEQFLKDVEECVSAHCDAYLKTNQ